MNQKNGFSEADQNQYHKFCDFPDNIPNNYFHTLAKILRPSNRNWNISKDLRYSQKLKYLENEKDSEMAQFKQISVSDPWRKLKKKDKKMGDFWYSSDSTVMKAL